jgi:hypothetical protein
MTADVSSIEGWLSPWILAGSVFTESSLSEVQASTKPKARLLLPPEQEAGSLTNHSLLRIKAKIVVG